MKNHKLKLLSAAVLASLGLAAQQASATSVSIASGVTNTPIKTANEVTTGLGIGNGVAQLTLDGVSGLNAGVAPLTVNFDLIGGLKFATVPFLSCETTVYPPAASASQVQGVGAVVVGGNGSSSVAFQINSGTLSSAPTCILSAAYSTTGSLATKTVSAVEAYSVGGISSSLVRTGSFITFNKSLTAIFTPAAGSVTVDATTGGQKFVSAGSANLLTAALGLVQLASGAITTADGSSVLTANLALTSASITVTGPTLAAGFSSVSGNIYLASAQQACNVGTNAVISYASKSGNSVTFNALDLTQLSTGYNVCLQVAGTHVIPTGAVTASITGTNATGYSVDTSATTSALATVGTNGSTMNAYFINASNSTSKTSVIRIINTAGYASTVLTGTAYSESGTVLGTANTSLGTVPSAGMLTLTSANIESLLGITGLAPTAKYRLVISSDLASFKVVNYIQDVATGAIHLAQQQDN